MAFDLNVGDALKGLFGLVDDMYTSDEEREEAKRKLIALQQANKLETYKTSLSAILAEAQSKDPWTSRARPSFMYVMYVMILMSIPMGIVAVFSPESATNITEGMQAFLTAIPDGLWTTFGIGYAGYTGARTYEKHSMSKNKK